MAIPLPLVAPQTLIALTSDHLAVDVFTDATTPQVLFSLPFDKQWDDSALIVSAVCAFVYVNGGAIVAQNAARMTMQLEGVDQGGNAFLVPLATALESSPGYMFAASRKVLGIAAGARVARIRWYLAVAPPAGDVIYCGATNNETQLASITVMEVLAP